MVSANPREPSTTSHLWLLVRAPVFAAALVALVVLSAVPLGWQQQTIFGAILIAIAAMLSLARRGQRVTLALMALSGFATVRYAWWRTSQTWDGITSVGHLHQWDTVLVLVLLAAEFYAFATLFLGYFQPVRPLGRRPAPLPADKSVWPIVDVYIPTYNEPLDVVRATVLGALAMDYAANKLNVYVLDDGRRDEFLVFAERVGVGYLTRPDNAHAKAGNINHA